MGTHPIFESDFDCLTVMVSAETVEYQIRPGFDEKFKRAEVEQFVRALLEEKLEAREYKDADAPGLMQTIIKEVLDGLQDMKMSPRFKYIVDVKYGENRGQGVTCVFRALWDSDSDKHQTISYTNESIFCTVSVFGI